jgi:hypothetical protein
MRTSCSAQHSMTTAAAVAPLVFIRPAVEQRLDHLLLVHGNSAFSHSGRQ